MKKHYFLLGIFLLIILISFYSFKKINDEKLATYELQQTHELVVVMTLGQISNVFTIGAVGDCLEAQKEYLHAYEGLIELKNHLKSNPTNSNHLLTITGYLELYFQHFYCSDQYTVDQEVIRNLMMDIISDVNNEANYLELETYLAKAISQ